MDNFWWPTSLDAVKKFWARLMKPPRRSSLKCEVSANHDSALFNFQSKMAAKRCLWGLCHNVFFFLSTYDESLCRISWLYDKVKFGTPPIGAMYFGFCRWRWRGIFYCPTAKHIFLQIFHRTWILGKIWWVFINVQGVKFPIYGQKKKTEEAE